MCVTDFLHVLLFCIKVSLKLRTGSSVFLSLSCIDVSHSSNVHEVQCFHPTFCFTRLVMANSSRLVLFETFRLSSNKSDILVSRSIPKYHLFTPIKMCNLIRSTRYVFVSFPPLCNRFNLAQ